MLSYHLLVSVAALIFAALVHAVLLTYFMGTSRWMEEARQAYKFDARWSEENRRLKYRTIPVMAVCLLLLISNIPLGAFAVDRADWTLPGLGAVSPSRVHLVFAVLTFVVNLAVNAMEYRAIRRNGELIAEVVGEVAASARPAACRCNALATAPWPRRWPGPRIVPRDSSRPGIDRVEKNRLPDQSIPDGEPDLHSPRNRGDRGDGRTVSSATRSVAGTRRSSIPTIRPKRPGRDGSSMSAGRGWSVGVVGNGFGTPPPICPRAGGGRAHSDANPSAES